MFSNPVDVSANPAAWPDQHEPEPRKAVHNFYNFKCTHRKQNGVVENHCVFIIMAFMVVHDLKLLFL